MERIEEILNDSGNHAVLKELAAREEAEVQELAELTGIKQERLEDKVRLLEQEELVTSDRGQVPTLLKIQEGNRQRLQDIREEIQQFHDDKNEILWENIEKEKELLERALEELQKKKEDVSTVTREKKFDRQRENVENALEKISEADSPEDMLEAYSLSHRALKLTGHREEEFHSFNPWRKLKASRKIDEVLEHEPEGKESRRFFGNRWVKKSRVE